MVPIRSPCQQPRVTEPIAVLLHPLVAGGSWWRLRGSVQRLAQMAGSAWGCLVVLAEGHETRFRSRVSCFPAFFFARGAL